MTLLDRHQEFVSALRAAGLTVSVAEDLDAVAAMRVLDLLDRDQLRAGYAASLVKRATHRPVFDTLFDVYFPPTPAPAARPESSEQSESDDPPERLTNRRRDDPELLRYRDQLADALLDGDERALRQLARDGVGRFGAVPGRSGGTSSWSSYATHTRISAQTLTARLLEALLGGGEISGLAERNARVVVETRLARFRAMVDTEVQRRSAADGDRDRVARGAVRPSLENIDLLSANRSDLASIRREIAPLARRLAARLAIERRRGRRGPVDMRRTIRASLSSGGTPLDTHEHPRRPRKTDLVIVCDISESVTSFARFTLMLVYALREQFTRVRVFAFVDRLDEVTRFFAPGQDVARSVAALGADADVRGWSGRTDYGSAFGMFAERYSDALTPRSSLLVLGDARSNYGDPGLRALGRMVDRARRSYWLNPERRGAWDTGDSVAAEYAAVLPMIECRNLAQLSGFVRDLV